MVPLCARLCRPEEHNLTISTPSEFQKHPSSHSTSTPQSNNSRRVSSCCLCDSRGVFFFVCGGRQEIQSRPHCLVRHKNKTHTAVEPHIKDSYTHRNVRVPRYQLVTPPTPSKCKTGMHKTSCRSLVLFYWSMLAFRPPGFSKGKRLKNTCVDATDSADREPAKGWGLG